MLTKSLFFADKTEPFRQVYHLTKEQWLLMDDMLQFHGYEFSSQRTIPDPSQWDQLRPPHEVTPVKRKIYQQRKIPDYMDPVSPPRPLVMDIESDSDSVYSEATTDPSPAVSPKKRKKTGKGAIESGKKTGKGAIDSGKKTAKGAIESGKKTAKEGRPIGRPPKKALPLGTIMTEEEALTKRDAARIAADQVLGQVIDEVFFPRRRSLRIRGMSPVPPSPPRAPTTPPREAFWMPDDSDPMVELDTDWSDPESEEPLQLPDIPTSIEECMAGF